MRFLLVSDLHYALKQYDWMLRAAPDFDVVVIAGDQLDISGLVDGSVQVLVVLKYLKRLMDCTKVMVCSGNHDLDARDTSGEKSAQWMKRVRQMGIPADGDSVVLDNILITICPWWDGDNAKQAVAAQLERESRVRKDIWIWVYHAPPLGSPISWDGRKFYGDAELSEWIARYQPDIVFCGHIHQAPFEQDGSWADRMGSTWVFNCGQQIGAIPTHIILDTDAREALWFSAAGVESAKLDMPVTRPLAQLEHLPAWLSSPGPGPNPG